MATVPGAFTLDSQSADHASVLCSLGVRWLEAWAGGCKQLHPAVLAFQDLDLTVPAPVVVCTYPHMNTAPFPCSFFPQRSCVNSVIISKTEKFRSLETEKSEIKY